MTGVRLICTPSAAFKVSPAAQSRPTASRNFLSRNPLLGPKKRPSIFAAKLWSGEGRQTNQCFSLGMSRSDIACRAESIMESKHDVHFRRNHHRIEKYGVDKENIPPNGNTGKYVLKSHARENVRIERSEQSWEHPFGIQSAAQWQEQARHGNQVRCD